MKKGEDIMLMLLDHYENPRNFGKLDDADVVKKAGNPSCGDLITIYLKIDKRGLVEDVKFDGEGCTISQSTMSILTEKIRGSYIDQLRSFSNDYIKEIIGERLFNLRKECSTVGLNVIKKALKQWDLSKDREKLDAYQR